jgi:Transposase DDE domain
VRSSKAVRLTHVKPGYYHPPGAPIFVPGIHGIGLLLAGRQARLGPPSLIAMRWGTSRGALASHEKDEHCKLLRLTAQDAWKVVLAYARRWRVEVLFRNLKSELAIQSLRVDRWEDRLKRLRLVTLAYAFLMEMMGKATKQARDWLLTCACHRTGTHLREVELPFSRLRLALSRLWLAYPCWFVRRGRLNL